MKRIQDIIYFSTLVILLGILLFQQPVQGQTFTTEKYVVTIGTTQQFKPDSAGFKNAVTRAKLLSRRYNERITIVVMPGAINIGNSYVILPDSVDWFWMPTVKITGSHSTGVVRDTNKIIIKWAGAPDVINTTDTTKTIVISDPGSELNYLYSVTTDGDSSLNPLNITGLSAGHVLQWSGTTWENKSVSSAGIATTAALNAKADSSRSYSKAMNDALLNGKQNADADLTTYAGITPSANIQTFLGSADYPAMRTNLSLVIGTNVQAYDADLTTYAGITPSANVQTLLGSSTYAAFKTSLGLNNVENYSLNTVRDSVLKDPVVTGSMGTEALYSTPVNLGLFTTAIDWKTSNVFYATCNSSREFTFTNTQEGQVITLIVLLTSSDAVTFNESSLEWPDDTQPTSSGGSGRDVYTFMRVGGKIYGAMIPYIGRAW